MADGVTNFPAAIAAAEQVQFLARSAEEGLDSILGYRQVATREIIPAGIGATYTHTRKGRLTPTTTASSPQASMSLDDGLTPSQYAIEQYTLTMYDYLNASGDVDQVQAQAGIFDQMLAISRNSGVHAAQSKDLLARNALFAAYLSGNTRVRGDDVAVPTTTTCHVDDIRGFQNVLVNGVLTPVSGSNTLSVVESGTTPQTLTVTAVAADGTNISTLSAWGGISGQLTFNTATAPTHGDALVAVNAPQIVRPNGRTTTAQLIGSDVLTIQMLLDMKVILENNGVPPFEEGMYRCLLDPTSLRQLYADQDFKIYFAGRQQSDEVQSGYISKILGIELIPTTQAIVQLPSSHTANSDTDAVNVTVRRPILCGSECLIEGTFQGLDNYLRILKESQDIVMAEMVDDTIQICRKPIDRGGRWYCFAWDWIGGYAVPTDATATTSIIPTASNALFKRCVVGEIAG
jgi:hypothetical protein